MEGRRDIWQAEKTDIRKTKTLCGPSFLSYKR
uniref:Uncharacterized protein n=1 Tax=Rhizophora mucronata TaxID=61149 RepID=A0A2P2MHQ1_RHIMU